MPRASRQPPGNRRVTRFHHPSLCITVAPVDYSRMTRWASFSLAGTVAALLALRWPFAGEAGPALPAEVLSLAGAVAALGFTGVVVSIAWNIRDRTPVLIALGCLTVAAGLALRAAFDSTGLGLAPSAGSAASPLIGVILTGGWFAFAALSADPAIDARLPSSRGLLVAGAALSVAACATGVYEPELLPRVETLQVASGLAAAGYLVAAFAFTRAWLLLRLSSQAAMSLGTYGFAVATVAMAGGGLPSVNAWQFEFIMLALGAMPVTGFLIEQRSRPGLRAMVMGLVLPGAAANMGRGYPAPMHRLLESVEDYDPALRGHINRVAAIAVRIGMRMRLNASHLREVALAAQLHDIGKIAIPRAILTRPGALTAEEFAVVKRHTTYGRRIVSRIPGLAVAAKGVGEHHERWDGTGYPNGCAGEAISLTGRIVAVADVYDALVSRRSYKEGWSPEEAIAEIVRGAGSHFDPRVVDELLAVVGAAEQVERSLAA